MRWRGRLPFVGRWDPELWREVGAFGLAGLPIPEQYGGSGAGVLAAGLALKALAYGGRDAGLNLSLGAFAITEPEAGSDTAGMKTSARREDDVYVLNGTETFITNGGLADVVTVVARTDPDAPPGNAFTAFLVETDWAGFAVSEELGRLGNRTSPTVELSFSDVEVPESAVLGEPGTAL